MKASLIFLIATLLWSFSVFGQEQQAEGDLDPKFAAYDKDAGFVCGQFLPNQITGMSEMMPLCGGRFGFKISKKTFLEPQLLAGAAYAQKYMVGSVNFRADMSASDFVISAYGGPDVHYVTTPTFNGTVISGDTTTTYFGVHFGGALWWEFTENLYLRTDLQFFLNPGTALFVGASLAFRFGGGGGQGGGGE